ncbi:MAG: molybdenum cofactor biosysynthesis protein, partial [Lentimonas sp.]
MIIKAIYISSGHDFVGRHGKGRLDHGIESVDSIECLAGRGIVGDRYLDHKEDFKGQITFFDWAVYEFI